MYEIIAYYSGFNKYLVKRCYDGLQFLCSSKILNFMLRLGLIGGENENRI